MIHEYATAVAEQMGLTLSRVALVNGGLLGCKDCHLLQLYSGEHSECAVIYQRDLVNLSEGIYCDRLETRIRSALTSLQIMKSKQGQAANPVISTKQI